MQGTRNYSDGLWDIPVHLSTMQLDSYIKLIQHGVVHNIRQVQYSEDSFDGKGPPKKRSVFNIFYKFSRLVDVNICDLLINRHLKRRCKNIYESESTTKNECYSVQRYNEE